MPISVPPGSVTGDPVHGHHVSGHHVPDRAVPPAVMVRLARRRPAAPRWRSVASTSASRRSCAFPPRISDRQASADVAITPSPASRSRRGPACRRGREPCARSRQALPGHPVVMPAQQQVGRVRAISRRGHDGDDHGPGRAAASAPRLPRRPPVNGIRAAPPRPLRPGSVPAGEARMEEARGHTPRIAARARLGRGQLPPHPGPTTRRGEAAIAAAARPGVGPGRDVIGRPGTWLRWPAWPGAGSRLRRSACRCAR